MPSQFDTVIIGAGAAGLAAGRKLHDAGQKILILEAQNRIGGRIQTTYDFADYPVEIGAEFIHGGQAITHDLIAQANFDIIPVNRKEKLRWAEPFAPALPLDQLDPALYQQIQSILNDYNHLEDYPLDQDLSLAEYLRRCGWDEKALLRADALIAQPYATTLERLSCFDIIREHQTDHAGEAESRLREGYSALLDWYAQDLPIQLNTPVHHIEWGLGKVRINGTYHAKTSLITIPVNLLDAGIIQFSPPLPADKLAAISQFQVEAVTKLLYRFTEQFWDDETTLIAHTGAIPRWWTSGYNRASTPVICGFVSSTHAQHIDAMSESDALALGLSELSQLLDVPLDTLQANCSASQRVSWANDPYARGAYATLPPHAAESRPILARPEGNTLFFAGEATVYYSNPQTVHGAIESGWKAAQEILASL